MPLGSLMSTWLGPSIWVFGNMLNILAKAHSAAAPRNLVPVPQIPWPIFWSQSNESNGRPSPTIPQVSLERLSVASAVLSSMFNLQVR